MMKHVVTLLLVLASVLSILARQEHFQRSRSAAARGHVAKANEVRGELQRLGADQKHDEFAQQCATFIGGQNQRMIEERESYSFLSNILLLATAIQIVATYIVRKAGKPNKSPGE